MSDIKKPRSDSKLDALNKEQKNKLRDGLLSGWSYDAAIAWLRDECGVESHLASMSAFYKRHCKPVLVERRQLAALKAEIIAEEAGKTDWDVAMVERLKQTVFEFMANPSADISETEKLFKLLLKHQDIQLSQRRVDVLEAKAKQADAATEVLKEQISPEEQNRRLREILR